MNTEQATGRNWSTAQYADLHVFDDCARITLTWQDGCVLHYMEDYEDDARKLLTRLGYTYHC